MREILFRGKDIRHRSQWKYGDFLSTSRPCVCIQTRHEYDEVVEWTIGQFTNMLAENGDKIFEGDIVEGDFFDDQVKMTGSVCLDMGCWVISTEVLSNGENLKIIGNIHDNPELLEKENE